LFNQFLDAHGQPMLGATTGLVRIVGLGHSMPHITC